ncbi:MAG: dihydropteroate synthase [Desulfobacterales bacterium]|nr:dihydropteroate synthase [Desulfobacterales bacterium]
MDTYKFSWRNYCLDLSSRTHVMGILNVTPDSFSDGGKYFSSERAIVQGEKLAEEGADIIDVGGESTRPFSDQVSAEEETRRVVPVIEKLVKQVNIPISIDSSKSIVVKRAIDVGASIINDISALTFDSEVGKLAAEYDIPIILMHMKGNPKIMQISPSYEDLISEIKGFLKDRILAAENLGISKSRIIIDPGIGFGKTAQHNLSIIKNISMFEDLYVPILIGPSRKWFIRHILKDKEGKDLAAYMPEVSIGTQAVISSAVLNGAHIVRVHDVKETVATIKIIDSIKNA